MAGKADGARRLRSVFIHIEEVLITCPLCGRTFTRFFRRASPAEGSFHPPLVTCVCGRYSYSHHA